MKKNLHTVIWVGAVMMIVTATAVTGYVYFNRTSEKEQKGENQTNPSNNNSATGQTRVSIKIDNDTAKQVEGTERLITLKLSVAQGQDTTFTLKASGNAQPLRDYKLPPSATISQGKTEATAKITLFENEDNQSQERTLVVEVVPPSGISVDGPASVTLKITQEQGADALVVILGTIDLGVDEEGRKKLGQELDALTKSSRTLVGGAPFVLLKTQAVKWANPHQGGLPCDEKELFNLDVKIEDLFEDCLKSLDKLIAGLQLPAEKKYVVFLVWRSDLEPAKFPNIKDLKPELLEGRELYCILDGSTEKDEWLRKHFEKRGFAEIRGDRYVNRSKKEDSVANEIQAVLRRRALKPRSPR